MGADLQTVAWDERLANLKLPQVGDPLPPTACRELALTVARKGVGRVSPNPLVGAVIVDRDHRFVAAGAHEQVGDAHAEIQALNAAHAANVADRIKGGTLYVTLEPCSHVGRTPACAPAVAGAGFATVVFGMVDPNPKVNGRGAAILRDQGIDVRHDLSWQRECEALAEVFVWNMRQGLPFVALKAATGLDGVMGRSGDQRAFITGERARTYGHYLRLVYDGIVVGASTLRLDNPDLTPRLALIRGRAPWRIVVDPRADALRQVGVESIRLLETEPGQVVWITGKDARTKHADVLQKFEHRGGRLIEIAPSTDGTLPAKAILTALHEVGLHSIMLEGGAGLYSGFLNDGLVNRLHLFQSPKLFGGEAIRFTESAKQLGLATLSDVQMTTLGQDWVIEGRFSQFNGGRA